MSASYLSRSYSQLYVFHSHKLVTSVREHWDYNLSRFVADAGGSLGFLLGVSVLSLVSLLSQACRAMSSSCSRATKVQLATQNMSQNQRMTRDSSISKTKWRPEGHW